MKVRFSEGDLIDLDETHCTRKIYYSFQSAQNALWYMEEHYYRGKCDILHCEEHDGKYHIIPRFQTF